MESTNADKETIKRWLVSRGRDRAWLAEKLGVRASTVDNWLSRGRAIPETKVHAIEELMMSRGASYRDVIAVPVRFTQQEWDALTASLPHDVDVEDVLREQVLHRVLTVAAREVKAAIGEESTQDLAASEDGV